MSNHITADSPTVIDDDIQRMAEGILRIDNDSGENLVVLEPEVHRRVLEAMCIALQGERNRWKERLQSSLHEIDRQHRASIEVERSLQELVSNLGLVLPSSPDNTDNTETQQLSGRRSADIIQTLQAYITHLQDTAERAANHTHLQQNIRRLQTLTAALEAEKTKQGTELSTRNKEVVWLQKELNSVKHQLQKLRRIVLNYNESHSTNFHLDDMEKPKDDPRAANSISRERTYVEGDLMNFFPTTGEEIAVWKLRNRQMKESSGHSSSRGSSQNIAQCLRCQSFFKPGDNNNMACRYHKKGREIREQYDNNGRLIRVLYKWACCKKGLDSPGCTHGYHI